jgi:hypothetical protein
MTINVFAVSRFSPGSACVALPLWDQKNEAEQSNRRSDRNKRPYQDNRANSPHPSSCEGHLSTGSGIFLSPLVLVTLVANYAATGKLSRVQQNSVPSLHMRCMITASRRANATTAFCLPRRLAIFIAHAFSHDHFLTFTSRTCAASYSRDRIIASPQQDTRPTRLLSPDSLSLGVSPSTEPTAFECAKRPGISMVAV